MATGQMGLVRDDFPSFHGMPTVVMSPDGSHVVYSVYGEDKSGIFILDVATGVEKPLLPTGDSLSFYPSWSLDGKYIAAYTVKKVPDPTYEGAARFNFIPGEDGPMSSAQEITVLDLEGNTVKTIAMEGQYLSHLVWLSGSKSLAYLSGPVTFGKWGEVVSSEYAAAFIQSVDPGSAPVKVADIAAIEKETGQHTTYVFPNGSLPGGAGALLNVAGPDSASVWRVSSSSPPMKVADGWWDTPRLNAEFLDKVAGVVSGGGESSLWLVSPSGASRFGEKWSNGLGIAAFNGDLIVTESHDFAANRTEIAVYDMLHERVPAKTSP